MTVESASRSRKGDTAESRTTTEPRKINLVLERRQLDEIVREYYRNGKQAPNHLQLEVRGESDSTKELVIAGRESAAVPNIASAASRNNDTTSGKAHKGVSKTDAPSGRSIDLTNEDILLGHRSGRVKNVPLDLANSHRESVRTSAFPSSQSIDLTHVRAVNRQLDSTLDKDQLDPSGRGDETLEPSGSSKALARHFYSVKEEDTKPLQHVASELDWRSASARRHTAAYSRHNNTASPTREPARDPTRLQPAAEPTGQPTVEPAELSRKVDETLEAGARLKEVLNNQSRRSARQHRDPAIVHPSENAVSVSNQSKRSARHHRDQEIVHPSENAASVRVKDASSSKSKRSARHQPIVQPSKNIITSQTGLSHSSRYHDLNMEELISRYQPDKSSSVKPEGQSSQGHSPQDAIIVEESNNSGKVGQKVHQSEKSLRSSKSGKSRRHPNISQEAAQLIPGQSRNQEENTRRSISSKDGQRRDDQQQEQTSVIRSSRKVSRKPYNDGEPQEQRKRSSNVEGNSNTESGPERRTTSVTDGRKTTTQGEIQPDAILSHLGVSTSKSCQIKDDTMERIEKLIATTSIQKTSQSSKRSGTATRSRASNDSQNQTSDMLHHNILQPNHHDLYSKRANRVDMEYDGTTGIRGDEHDNMREEEKFDPLFGRPRNHQRPNVTNKHNTDRKKAYAVNFQTDGGETNNKAASYGMLNQGNSKMAGVEGIQKVSTNISTNIRGAALDVFDEFTEQIDDLVSFFFLDNKRTCGGITVERNTKDIAEETLPKDFWEPPNPKEFAFASSHKLVPGMSSGTPTPKNSNRPTNKEIAKREVPKERRVSNNRHGMTEEIDELLDSSCKVIEQGSQAALELLKTEKSDRIIQEELAAAREGREIPQYNGLNHEEAIARMTEQAGQLCAALKKPMITDRSGVSFQIVSPPELCDLPNIVNDAIPNSFTAAEEECMEEYEKRVAVNLMNLEEDVTGSKRDLRKMRRSSKNSSWSRSSRRQRARGERGEDPPAY